MADSTTVENLTKLATEFRQRIENTDKTKLAPYFEDFPMGSCEDSSLLLSQYLIEAGYEMPIYVVGELVTPTRVLSHAWLELDGIVLDITVDSFGPDLPPIIVAETSEFHEQFDRLKQYPAEIANYDTYTKNRLVSAYQVLTGQRAQ